MRVRDDDVAAPSRRATRPAVPEDLLVARLEALSAPFAVDPDEEFRATTRTRLVAMAAVRTPDARRPPVRVGTVRRLLTGTTEAPAPRWRTRLTAGLAGAALTVTVLGGLLAAASGAHPGDLLYDVKRGGEQTHLVLAGDSGRGTTLLGFARTRLDEVHALVGVDADADAVVGTTPSGGELALAAGPDVDLVLGTLQTMDAQTAEGTAALTARAVDRTDTDALGVLTGWAADQESGLDELTDAVPTGAEVSLRNARRLVDRVATRGSTLREALNCAGGPATAGTDDLGPLPAPCPPTPDASATATTTAAGAAPSGSSAAGTSASAPSSARSAATPRSTAPAPTTGAVPPTPGAGTGGAPRATVAPPSVALPSLSLPSVTLPSLTLPSIPPVPGFPGSSAAPASSPGAVVSVPPLGTGVSICLPPLITVGC